MNKEILFLICFIMQFHLSRSQEIRKAFDGSRNEQKPANFTYLHDNEGEKDYWLVDFAIKTNSWNAVARPSFDLQVFPKMEWHKNTDIDNEYNKISLGLNTEIMGHSAWGLRPTFFISSAYKRNFIEKGNEHEVLFQFSMTGTHGYSPGCSIRSGPRLVFRYYPYMGFENYSFQDVIVEGQLEFVSLIFVRLYMEYWPFSSIQIIVDMKQQKNISDSPIVKERPYFLNPSINYYPGNQDNFSVGIEYRKGYDSKSQFEKINQLSIKLNYKL